MTKRNEFDAIDDQLQAIARLPREVNPDPQIFDSLSCPRPLVWIALAWLIALAVGMLLWAKDAHSTELRAVATIAAWHEYREYWCGADARFQDYESAIPGVGIGADFSPDVMAAAGVWRNSHGRASAFGLVDWRPLHWGPASFGLFAGASGGYCRNGRTNAVLPLGGATVRIDVDRFAVHLLAVPPTDWKPMTVAVALSIAF